MTKEQAKEWLPFIQAWVEGKSIQFRNRNQNKWHDCEDVAAYFFDDSDLKDERQFRIKPEQNYRPWTPEEVPVGAQVKDKNARNNHRWLITAIWSSQVFLNGSNADGTSGKSLSYMYDEFLVSTDNGKTWQPCGVLEES